MLFNSIEFVLFLPLVIILYYLLPHRYRWIMLLAASYYFYMSWRIEYIFLIIGSTLIDYMSGRMIKKMPDVYGKSFFLVLSLVTNLGLLFSFKYYDLFTSSAELMFGYFNIFYHFPDLKVLLPVGISFYTFQTLSYTIEVFQGKQEPEKHLGYFALYVSFFPQLVAGPIERYNRLAPQLKTHHKLQLKNIVNGLRLILFGLFIKMVIADNLSVYVDQIYDAPETFSSWSLLQGIFLYSFQIYSDFYGYSTIAIGASALLGVQLMDNFNTPYLAKSIGEFWQRWHISLSTWFRDYLYFPMGGNRVKKWRWVFNIFVVFTVSGLWHGANWTFVFWGALYGIIYVMEDIINKKFGIKSVNSKFSGKHILLAIKTFVLVTFIWIFFRSQHISDAFTMFKSLATNFTVKDSFSVDLKVWIFLFLFILFDVILYNSRFDKWIGKRQSVIRWTVYAVLLFLIIVFSGVEDQPFIYFQF